MNTGMTARYDMLIQGIAKSDQTILIICALTVAGLFAWHALNWLPGNVQLWTKRIFATYLIAIWFALFLYR